MESMVVLFVILRMQINMYTHQQLLDRQCSIDEYYIQFSNAEASAYVIGFLGRDRIILEFKKNPLYQIPAFEFERMFALKSMINAKILRECDENWTMYTQVFITKAIINEFLKNNLQYDNQDKLPRLG